MNTSSITCPADKKSLYRLLRTKLQGMTDGVTDLTASLANISALLNQALPRSEEHTSELLSP